MDINDQRDYSEETANAALLHEECDGCETCQPDNPTAAFIHYLSDSESDPDAALHNLAMDTHDEVLYPSWMETYP